MWTPVVYLTLVLVPCGFFFFGGADVFKKEGQKSGDARLLESSAYRLLESGDYRLLE